MAFFHYFLPFEKIQLETRLPLSEIMTRMNWFIQTPLRGGNLNGYFTSGYVNEKNFFFEYHTGNGIRRVFNQYAATIEGNKIWFFVRIKPTLKKGLTVFGVMILLSAIIVPLVEPEKISEIGEFWGGVGIIYCYILFNIKREAEKTKDYLFHMLEARKIN